jgi:hypothetical protein
VISYPFGFYIPRLRLYRARLDPSKYGYIIDTGNQPNDVVWVPRSVFEKLFKEDLA